LRDSSVLRSEPFVEPIRHGVGEGREHGLLFQRKPDERDEVGKASGLRTAFDLAGIGRRTAVKDLQRGDLGLVLLDVFAEGGGELGAGLRASLRWAGVNQGVAGNDVNRLVGGLGDFLEQVAEIGICSERGEGGFDQLFGSGFKLGGSGFDVRNAR